MNDFSRDRHLQALRVVAPPVFFVGEAPGIFRSLTSETSHRLLLYAIQGNGAKAAREMNRS
jgi:hypothetical protein